MPRPRTVLPDAFASNPFTVTEARLAGASGRLMDHARYARPFRNVRVLKTQHDLFASEEMLSLVLREGEAFSHTTALKMYGCPIRTNDVIHVTVPNHRRARRLAGVAGHSTRWDFAPVEARNRLPVVPPVLALVQAADLLPLKELIVAIDHFLTARATAKQWLTAQNVQDLQQLTRRSRSKGGRNLQRALRFARVGAESRMETLVWLLLEAYGLAHHFAPQVEITHVDGWIGRFDLVSEKFKLIVEYDGEQHRTDRHQYLKDELRLDRVRAAGYLVIRLRADDVLGHGARDTVRRIVEALGLAGMPRLIHADLL